MNIFAIAILVFIQNTYAAKTPDYAALFKDREACFLMVDLKTKAKVTEHNPKLCRERFSPYSTFKIPASLMAFNEGIFKSEQQIIKWDGFERGRAEIDQDLTPLTFMSASAKWVTEWIMPQVGDQKIRAYLKDFKYGNQDFSGGMRGFWVSSSLKISAVEQVDFLSRLWQKKLKVTPKAVEQTQNVSRFSLKGHAFEIWGKTGTGCVSGHTCMTEAAPMFGWYVGVVKKGEREFAFAGHAKDLVSQKEPGGPRQRDTTIEILKGLDLSAQ